MSPNFTVGTSADVSYVGHPVALGRQAVGGAAVGGRRWLLLRGGKHRRAEQAQQEARHGPLDRAAS